MQQTGNANTSFTPQSATLIKKRNQRKNCKRNPNGSQEAAQQDRQVHCNVDQVCLSAHVKPEEHVFASTGDFPFS